MICVGVDWSRAGWVAAVAHPGRQTTVEVMPSFRAIVQQKEWTHIVIDIPIGLPEVGGRSCDLEARRLLAKRGCTVFPAPLRSMLSATTYEEACRIRFAVEGKRTSRQAWEIIRLVREVDEQMSPELQGRIREGHPEVTFAVMAGGHALSVGKKGREGKQLRAMMLEREFDDYRRPRGIDLVDVNDAYAMLWTARRWAANAHSVLPNMPHVDGSGLRQEMIS